MLRRSRYLQLTAIPLVFSLLSLACLAGCGVSAQSQSGTGSSTSGSAAFVSDMVTAGGNPADSQSLAAIRKLRTEAASSKDFPVGPGDVLEVSVPAMEELRNRQARVSEENTIELPIIGTVDVRGMDEEEITEALRGRLREYMKDPQVEVFIKQYRSREVAVAGMVQKPGLYTLTSRSDTILDLIGRAGGVQEKAGTHIIFIPAADADGSRLSLPSGLSQESSGQPSEPSPQMQYAKNNATSGAIKPVAAEGTVANVSEVTESNQSGGEQPDYFRITAVKGRDPIVIDLASLKRSAQLDVPVCPGDVIIVPAAGAVMVRGWVKNPGAFNITPGMTVLGAITAAGGEMYSSSAELLRTADNGAQVQTPVNLSAIQRGQEPDLAVQSGDVVVVNQSAVGAVPYFLTSLFNKFSTGAYIPVY